MFLVLPYLYLKKRWGDSDAVKIVRTFGWYFFVLLNAFHGGAMTMFFATEAGLPFDTVRDVIRLYPGKYIYMPQLTTECLQT